MTIKKKSNFYVLKSKVGEDIYTKEIRSPTFEKSVAHSLEILRKGKPGDECDIFLENEGGLVAQIAKIEKEGEEKFVIVQVHPEYREKLEKLITQYSSLSRPLFKEKQGRLKRYLYEEVFGSEESLVKYFSWLNKSDMSSFEADYKSLIGLKIKNKVSGREGIVTDIVPTGPFVFVVIKEPRGITRSVQFSKEELDELIASSIVGNWYVVKE